MEAQASQPASNRPGSGPMSEKLESWKDLHLPSFLARAPPPLLEDSKRIPALGGPGTIGFVLLFSVSLNGPLQHPPTVYECLGCEGQDHPVWVCWLDYPSLLVLTQTGWFRCVFVLKEIISAGRRLAALEQWEESLGSAVDEGMSSVQRNKRPWTEHLRVWIQHLLAVPCRSAKWILMDLKLELLVLHHPFLWPRHTGQPCLFLLFCVGRHGQPVRPTPNPASPVSAIGSFPPVPRLCLKRHLS